MLYDRGCGVVEVARPDNLVLGVWKEGTIHGTPGTLNPRPLERESIISRLHPSPPYQVWFDRFFSGKGTLLSGLAPFQFRVHVMGWLGTKCSIFPSFFRGYVFAFLSFVNSLADGFLEIWLARIICNVFVRMRVIRIDINFCWCQCWYTPLPSTSFKKNKKKK